MPFQQGNKLARGGVRPGGGRKPDALKAQLQGLMDKALDETKWLAILQGVYVEARFGNVKAAAFLFDRKFGRPVQHLEIEGGESDVDAIDLSLLSVEELEFFEHIMAKATPDVGRDGGLGGDGSATEPSGSHTASNGEPNFPQAFSAPDSQPAADPSGEGTPEPG